MFSLGLIKRFKCFRSLKCVDYLENKFSPGRRFNGNEFQKKKPSKSSLKSQTDNEIKVRTPSTNSFLKRKKVSIFSTQTDFFETNETLQKFCCCLFSNETNDFFQSEKQRRKSSNIFRDLKNRRLSNRNKSLMLVKQRQEDKSLGSIFNKSATGDDSEELKSMIKEENAANEIDKTNLVKKLTFVYDSEVEKEVLNKNAQPLNNIELELSKNDIFGQTKKENFYSSSDSSHSLFIEHTENEMLEPLLKHEQGNNTSSSSLVKEENWTTKDSIVSNSSLFEKKCSCLIDEIENKQSESLSESETKIENALGNDTISENKEYHLTNSLIELLVKSDKTVDKETCNQENTFDDFSSFEDEMSLRNLFRSMPDLHNFFNSCFSLYLDEFFQLDLVNKRNSNELTKKINFKRDTKIKSMNLLKNYIEEETLNKSSSHQKRKRRNSL